MLVVIVALIGKILNEGNCTFDDTIMKFGTGSYDVMRKMFGNRTIIADLNFEKVIGKK